MCRSPKQLLCLSLKHLASLVVECNGLQPSIVNLISQIDLALFVQLEGKNDIVELLTTHGKTLLLLEPLANVQAVTGID